MTVRSGMSYSSPGNPTWGNVLADIDLKTWFYVPLDIEPGTYQLDPLGVTQSPAFSISELLSYFPIINAGDMVKVLPPPCTISTQASIVFDTSSEAGMKVSAPVTFTCGNFVSTPNLEAFLQVRPLGATTSATEMNLAISGSQPGGVVRGYAGLGLSSSDADCQDNSFSLSFKKPFAVSLGTQVSNAFSETPLIWQLCRKGNEGAGLATGSAILSVNYK